MYEVFRHWSDYQIHIAIPYFVIPTCVVCTIFQIPWICQLKEIEHAWLQIKFKKNTERSWCKNSRTEIGKKYGISKSILSTLIKGKQKVLAIGNASNEVAPPQKYVQKAKFSDIEKDLAIWLLEIRNKNIPSNKNRFKEQTHTFVSHRRFSGFGSLVAKI